MAEVNGENVTITVSGLAQNTRYYCRTFFTNPTGTYFGNEVIFNTAIGSMEIATLPIENISYSGALSGGTITADGGSEISARGICWKTTSSPTINDSKSIDKYTDLGSYGSPIDELMLNKTLFVRAFATNDADTFYGQEEMVVIESQTYVPYNNFEQWLIN